jgi:hypothetical protein
VARGTLLLVGSVLVTSCTLLNPLGDFAGESASAKEAGADALADRELPDAMNASDAADATSSLDAGADADAGFSCAALSPTPRLCVDFGNGRVHSAGQNTSTDFAVTVATGSPFARLDTANFASAPASALFELSPSNTRVTLSREFTTSATRFELAASFAVDAPSMPRMDLFELNFAAHILYLRLLTTGHMEVVEAQFDGSTTTMVSAPDRSASTEAWLATSARSVAVTSSRDRPASCT